MTPLNIAFATDGGSPERPNEDWVGATPNAVVVLDGVTAPRGIEIGCHHNVSWFVHQFGHRLIANLVNDVPIVDSLAEAIRQVGDLHADTCDIAAPGNPAAAVAIIRARGQLLEHLVLADTSIAIDTTAGIVSVTDRRVDDAAPEALARTREDPIGSPEHQLKVAEMSVAQLERRNVPGGYWVASGDPGAAENAVTGSTPLGEVTRAAALTDGASRLVDTFHEVSWMDCLNLLQEDGPRGLISYVRHLENTDPAGQKWPRFKKSDDATVALVRI